MQKVVGLPLDLAAAKPTSIPPVKTQNQIVVDEYCANLESFDYLILSLFDEQRFISAFPRNASRKLLLYYDLIPYLFPDKYLEDPILKNHYFARFDQLFSADQVFTISETTRHDLIAYLGMSPSRLFNINGAPIPRTGEKCVPTPPPNFPDRPFVLLPTGQDQRKTQQPCVPGVSKIQSTAQQQVSFGSDVQFQQGESRKAERAYRSRYLCRQCFRR